MPMRCRTRTRTRIPSLPACHPVFRGLDERNCLRSVTSSPCMPRTFLPGPNFPTTRASPSQANILKEIPHTLFHPHTSSNPPPLTIS